MSEPIHPQERLFWEGVSDETWREPPRLLFDTELVYTTLGPFKLELAGKVFEMTPGSLALIPPQDVARKLGGTGAKDHAALCAFHVVAKSQSARTSAAMFSGRALSRTAASAGAGIHG